MPHRAKGTMTILPMNLGRNNDIPTECVLGGVWVWVCAYTHAHMCFSFQFICMTPSHLSGTFWTLGTGEADFFFQKLIYLVSGKLILIDSIFQDPSNL